MAQVRSLFANRWFTWLAGLGILIALLVLFREQLDFVGQAVTELRDAQPPALVLAVLSSLLSLLAMAEVMRRLLAAGHTDVSLAEANALTLASNAWSTSLPGGPAFSAVLTFQVQRRWGASVLLCGWFFVISSAISTMWLIVIAIAAILFLGAEVSVWSLAVSFVVMAVAGWLVYWILRNPQRLEAWTHTWLPRINRLLRRAPDAGVATAVEQIRQLDTVDFPASAFAVTSLHSLLNRLFDATTLWLAVWAVTGALPGLEAGLNQTTVMGVALAYITAKLAGSAQVTPGGLGTVEAAIIAVLVATGMTAVNATAAAIVYRAISFLLITVLGWVVYFLRYARDGFSGPRQLAARREGQNTSEVA